MNFEEKELLQWWLDKDPLTSNEKKLIHSNRPNYLIQNNKYMYLLDEYFDLIEEILLFYYNWENKNLKLT